MGTAAILTPFAVTTAPFVVITVFDFFCGVRFFRECQISFRMSGNFEFFENGR
jgi:hypothetical protein